mmetsp:Transcript_2910/g.5053  ORF Transcript_2910/g.5053 Transcript_2910/m.5053 type:complete len:117 (+) Transcript_2910:339-689(+)
MSPVVFMLPVTCRSADSSEAGGFALGALALNSDALGAAGAGAAGVAGAGLSALGPGSLILLLENIVCCLDVDHGVYGFAADADFVVQMHTGHPSRGSHITDPIPARDPFTNFYTKP